MCYSGYTVTGFNIFAITRKPAIMLMILFKMLLMTLFWVCVSICSLAGKLNCKFTHVLIKFLAILLIETRFKKIIISSNMIHKLNKCLVMIILSSSELSSCSPLILSKIESTALVFLIQLNARLLIEEDSWVYSIIWQ